MSMGRCPLIQLPIVAECHSPIMIVSVRDEEEKCVSEGFRGIRSFKGAVISLAMQMAGILDFCLIAKSY